MQLTGIHHLTAVTANAPDNHAFYTGTLGMRLAAGLVRIGRSELVLEEAPIDRLTDDELSTPC